MSFTSKQREQHHKELLWIIKNPEFCRSCERVLKGNTVYIPPDISRHDYRSRECYVYCTERCYNDLEYNPYKYIDKSSGNIYILNENNEYILYDIPGKTYK